MIRIFINAGLGGEHRSFESTFAGRPTEEEIREDAIMRWPELEDYKANIQIHYCQPYHK